MKIVYSEEKTVARMNAAAEEYAKAKKRRNTVRLINLATTLVILTICIFCAATHTALPTATGLLYIAVLLFNVVGTVIVDKSVPKTLPLACPDEVWHHIQTSGLTVLEVKTEKDNGRCTVSVILDDHGEEKTVDIGVFDVQESAKVKVETLDLEAETVYVPIAAQSE